MPDSSLQISLMDRARRTWWELVRWSLAMSLPSLLSRHSRIINGIAIVALFVLPLLRAAC